MIEQKQQITQMPPRPPMARMAPPVAGLTPREIYGILRRHIWLIICMAIIGFTVGGVSWYLLRKYNPKYTAQTLIEVLSPGRVDPTSMASPSQNKDIDFQFRTSKAALIKQQNTLEQLLRRDKIRNTAWFKNFGDNLTDQIDDLKDNLNASAERDSQYIRISMTCGNKVEAALIVNEMLELFLASQRQTTEGDIAAKLKEYRALEATNQKQLDQAQLSLDETRRISGFANLQQTDESQHTVTLKLNDLETEINHYRGQLREIEAAVETLEKRATGEIDVVVKNQIETELVNIGLTQNITALESELARKLTKMGENHPEVKQTKEQIKKTIDERELRRAQIAEQVRQSNLATARDQLEMIRKRLADLEEQRLQTMAQERDLDNARAQYMAKLAIRDERRETLGQIKQQIEKYNMMLNDPEAPKVRSMGYAPEPLEISFPKLKMFLPGGLVFGFMLGVGLAFLIELLNDLVRTPVDVTKHLHVPLLGMICSANDDEQARDIDLSHIVRQAPYSMVSECYRQLRTNLKLFGVNNSQKIIFFTSGSAGEGKTSVAVNVASTLLAEDKKVLLIDANFRRPTSINLFPKAESNGFTSENGTLGLSNLLSGQCSYEDVIRPCGIAGLDVIDAGVLPFNSAELLGNARMAELLRKSRENYDYILIDGPPVLLVSDAKVLATQSEATIVVLNAALTRRGTAMRTIRELREINTVVAGCVLLGAKIMKGGYFGEMLRSYQDYQKAQVASSV